MSGTRIISDVTKNEKRFTVDKKKIHFLNNECFITVCDLHPNIIVCILLEFHIVFYFAYPEM